MRRRIAVIGGGIAGLAVARELARREFAVTILEAKERLGGRVHTISHGDAPIELGAEFLHGENKPVHEAIEAAGLAAQSVSNQQRLFENGALRPKEIWEKISRLIHRVNPQEPDTSFQTFLESQRLDESDRNQAISFVQGFHAAHADQIGAHALLRGEVAAEKMSGSSQGRVVQGYSALAEFLAKEILARGGTILSGVSAREVDWRRGGASIGFQRGEKIECLEVDAAVITVSLGALKAGTIEFYPPVVEKQAAIRDLQFGNVAKIIFVFRERWWPEPDFGFVQAPDLLIPTWWSDPRGPILTGWAGGPKADALLNFSPAQLEKIGLRILEKVFGVSALAEKLAGSHTHNWARDPHVLGAYSYIPPKGLDLPRLLAEPVAGTLFFAGEATALDGQTGTVFSAFESGLRVAREIVS